MLKLGVPKVYVGSSNFRRVWGHAPRPPPPGKFLKIRYQQIGFGGIFGGLAVNEMLPILIHA